jgi:hypothetical protein
MAAAPAGGDVPHTAHDVHDYIDATEPLEHGVDNSFTALGRRDVRPDEPFFGKFIGTGTRRRQNVRTCLAKACDDGFADAFGSARNERPKPQKFGCGAH